MSKGIKEEVRFKHESGSKFLVSSQRWLLKPGSLLKNALRIIPVSVSMTNL